MAAISLQDLSLSFDDGNQLVPVLNDISLEVENGSIFGLVGESGSGKSTVLRCIAGLYDHWTGTILLEGQKSDGAIARERARLIQMVFQDPYASLHPRHTVNAVLSEALKLHGMDRIDWRIDKALTDVGLDTQYRYRYPHQLSGGQRQRVAIARALILGPRILLLDEPTSALDVSVQAEILNLLMELQESQKLSYLIVSHDLAVIAHMCDRLAVMQSGRVVESLTRQDLVDGAASDPYTRALIEASQAYDRDMARRLAV
ncbi:MAG TPA: ABC transporter ATP-binding protein [Devosiaceae bacterium]|jgi:peptide/nickel transport system ATP-binding protein